LKDNYIWLIAADERAVIVDPGDAAPVLEALTRHRLAPAAILCTHHHADHVGGVTALVERFNVPVYGPARELIPGVTHKLDGGEDVELPGLGVRVEAIATPGHTHGQINYFGAGMLFSGDTLFSAGCGRLFEGSADELHASLTRLAALPESTRVYCGHEYTEANLRFALTVEPDNCDARNHLATVQQWRAAQRPSLPSTIGLERRINPFLRAHLASVRAAAESFDGGELASSTDVFAALRRWKDGFRG
jgi:hydroxyacylglutathione hydrolase